ncbi:MAG: amidohydrolase family protein [Rhodospirillaceae bacterium]|jgi:2-pyrone-4,6-dicarboxylate lactonase|nr:amidohydrolase family protein [Rhodospirillaceae bacterium]MBT5459049.1 amidohydrolase family protein [Rhodospirillaceae bacterium]
MTEDRYPLCQGPDPDPTPPGFDLPAGTIDCHAHIFGPVQKYPMSPARGYTPPEASLETFLGLHETLGGIERAVLTQPSVYGTDNSCMLDAVAEMDGNFLAVVAVDADVSDRELEDLHERGARGARVNIVDPGGNPFDGMGAVRAFTDRLKDLGWHLEVLIHVHEFENLRETMNSLAVPVSVGHLGYMKTDNGIDHPGFREFLDLLRDGNTWVKLSGSYRITTSPATPYDDVTPFARAIIEANEDRVIWGTDWPHPFVKGTMPNDGALLDHLTDWAPDPALRKKILVDNGETLFGF